MIAGLKRVAAAVVVIVVVAAAGVYGWAWYDRARRVREPNRMREATEKLSRLRGTR